MDQDVLVNDRVASGEAALRSLDSNGYPVCAAFWNYYSELGGWRLVIVPEGFSGGAVTDELLKIRRAFNQQSTPFDLSDIKLLPASDPLVRALSKFMRVDGMSGTRFTGNWIDGVYIEDAYVYRMAL
ncbi:hypothetical protein L2D00_06380 [Hyphomonadaceae bacterium BL14]|nr:hypothetical protein L2D00_06380 [Hyphomonadaceae bacterium BL14]